MSLGASAIYIVIWFLASNVAQYYYKVNRRWKTFFVRYEQLNNWPFLMWGVDAVIVNWKCTLRSGGDEGHIEHDS